MPERSGPSVPRAARPLRSAAVARQMDAQLLAGMQVGVRAQAVPGEQLWHAALEEARDQRGGIALAHRVLDVPPVYASASVGRELDALTRAQLITRLQAVHQRKRVHVHAGAARNGPQRISATHDLHV